MTLNAAKSVTATFAVSNVAVQVGRVPETQAGTPTLTSTITARANCGGIGSVVFGQANRSFDNAVVSITSATGAPTSQTSGFTYTPTAGTNAVTFTIRRAVPGGGATVSPIVVHDTCGEWRTFVGGGPAAFK